VSLLLLLAACSGPKAPPADLAEAAESPDSGGCTLLTVNDTYRIEENADGSGGMARLRALRAELDRGPGDVLLLHAGDFLYPSLLSRTYKGAQMVEAMNALDGEPEKNDPRMFVVFGNHEREAKGFDPVSYKPDKFTEHVKKEMQKWPPVFKSAGIKVNN